ncbi:TonB-dependent receptor [Marinicaulis aureus]|uniref:TonB-dependent receptor n=1 Tax=Hyphococcus aureus TaxID=2666033 RepID=A0ABW1KZ55_9PROT
MACGTKIALLASSAMAALTVSAHAQGENGDGGPLMVRDEIIVTSRFREESIQDIGASVAGLSGDDINDLGVRDLEDVARLVAGLQNIKSQQNSNDIAIRGVKDAKAGAYATSSVYSLFLDDVSVASPGQQRDYSSVDLERIEVIRGPQPTLFGEGAVGGVIRYFTADPDLDGPGFTGVARGQLETIKDGGLAYSGENASSLILAPGKLGLRVSGFYRKDEGFIDNPSEGEDVNDFDSFGGRAVLLARPTEALEVRLSAFLMRDDLGESTQVDPGSDPEDLTFSSSPMSGFVTDDFDLYTGKISYDFGAIKLTSITGYYERDNIDTRFSAGNSFGLQAFFASDTPGGSIDTTTFQNTATKQEQFSQEFRFVSDFDGPVNFTSGLYYRDKDIMTVAGLDCAGCAAVTTPARDYILRETSTTNSTQYSGFLEVTYSLTDQLRLIGGVRYVDDKVVATFIDNNVINLVPRFDMGGNLIPWTESDPIDFVDFVDLLLSIGASDVYDFHLKRFLPRGGVEFEINGDILLYANAAVGARNGGVGQGVSALAIAGPDPMGIEDAVKFDEDSVLTVEAGVKSSWLDGDLIANLGVFHTKFKDTQIIIAAPATQPLNGPDQRIIGLELETLYRFDDNFSGFFNMALLDAEFTGQFATLDTPPPGAPMGQPFYDIKDGNAATHAPKLSFSTGYSYERPLGSGDWKLTSTGVFQYIGERFATVQNYPSSRLDSLENLNLRIGLENDRVALNLFATNLLNDIEVINSSANLFSQAVDANGILDAPAISASVNRPRTLGVSLTLRY